MRHGYTGATELLRLLSDPNLPPGSCGSSGNTPTDSDRRESGVPNSDRECLQRCAAARSALGVAGPAAAGALSGFWWPLNPARCERLSSPGCAPQPACFSLR